jgi:hypothetical protein
VPPCAASCSPKRVAVLEDTDIYVYGTSLSDEGCTQCTALPFLLAHNHDHPYIHNICIFLSVATLLELLDPENRGSILLRAGNSSFNMA